MPRVALAVSYNGQSYHGWQSQHDSIRTVQQELTSAVCAVADEAVTLYCAGRTDTGVHATKQIVHFDCCSERPEKAWTRGVNAHLSDAVAVSWASQVGDQFDARRTATARRYLYLIFNQRLRSAIGAGLLTHEHRNLDHEAMHQSAQALLGEQDFSSFRAANCQSNSPMRNVHRVSVWRRQDLIGIDIEANAFLHHMVRNIAGALMDVGAGIQSDKWIGELLALKDRTQGSITAPPNGLYLIDVKYPAESGIPVGPNLPHLLQVAH